MTITGDAGVDTLARGYAPEPPTSWLLAHFQGGKGVGRVAAGYPKGAFVLFSNRRTCPLDMLHPFIQSSPLLQDRRRVTVFRTSPILS